MLKVLGNTNTVISSVGQGTGFDFSKKISIRDMSALIRKGVDLHLNFIDSAESYGQGVSEEIVGRAIKGIRRRVIVATKFAPEHSLYKDVIKACDNSLKRLKTDVIDLYQFHWPNPNVPLSETLGAMEDLRRAGKIRYIGIANFSKKEIVGARKILKGAAIISLQSEYNLMERSIEQNGILDYCNKNKISIIAYSPLDQGRLNSFNKKQMRILNLLCKKYQKTTAQIMLAWLISHRQVVVIPRTTSLEHLIENSEIKSFSIDKIDVAEISKAFLMKLVHIPTEHIHVSTRGDKNSKVYYKTIDEAIANKLGFVPSPLDLSEEIKNTGLVKPVRLVRTRRSRDYDYDLISGRSRYWGWVIAYGNKRPIPAFVREKYD